MKQGLYLPKARESFHAWVLSAFSICLLLALQGCGDELDIPNQPLQGLIANESWSNSTANAFVVTADRRYIVRFLNESEPVSDPCTLPSPGRTHVKAIFRPSIGDFSIAPFAIDDNQVQVAFELPGGTSLIAISGSMSVFDINNATVVGYLQAEFDDENQVEGVFTISICNF